MDLNENEPELQDKKKTYYRTSQETKECWAAIDNLLYAVCCDIVYFSLHDQNHKFREQRIKNDQPIVQRWSRCPVMHPCNNTKNRVLINIGKYLQKHTMEKICEIVSSNGGTNETYIHQLDNLGYLRIVFIDRLKPDEKERIRRQVTLDHLLPHLTAPLLQWLINRKRVMKGKQLTRREMEVLHWAREGKSTWEAAHILGITERTIKYHLNNIYRKLDSTNRTQAVSTAIKQGLI
jgi:DNA-binding CsgD family transcriptional regulator